MFLPGADWLRSHNNSLGSKFSQQDPSTLEQYALMFVSPQPASPLKTPVKRSCVCVCTVLSFVLLYSFLRSGVLSGPGRFQHLPTLALFDPVLAGTAALVYPLPIIAMFANMDVTPARCPSAAELLLVEQHYGHVHGKLELHANL